MKKNIFYVSMFVLGLLLLAGFSHLIEPTLFHLFEESSEHSLIITFFEVALIFILSFFSFYLSKNIPIPSFVTAIFIGIACQPLLQTMRFANEGHLLSALVSLGAALILFGGGLETPFHNFKKLVWKILALSFPGLLVSAIGFSAITLFLANWIGVGMTIPAVVLLGAVLASTDPAAIIPVLKKLRFKNNDTKDIVISESAMTDVTGTLLTFAFLGIVVKASELNISFDSISSLYQEIFTLSNLEFLWKQLGYGIFFGFLGFLLPDLLVRFKHRHEEEHETDSAFFLSVPLVIFALTLAVEGSGYLAAFITGLLFTFDKKLKGSEHFYNQLVEGYLKPMIFILLGAMINLTELVQYAGVGILSALAFMFVVRPICVFVSLTIFCKVGKKKMNVRELLFISFVRETGAIPAVLLVAIVGKWLPGMEGFLPIGMWCILLTLIIQPIFTPLVARKLNVASIIEDKERIEIPESHKPSTVLVTRGYTFLERIDHVVEWSTERNISNIIVLLCLESKYSQEEEAKISQVAKEKFDEINSQEAYKNIQFLFISRKGMLQENITDIWSNKELSVVAIFVGRRMLDYRLEEIKRLPVPLAFVE